jgi:hypothetical protein
LQAELPWISHGLKMEEVEMEESMSRGRRLTGNFLIAFPAVVLIGAAAAKIAGVPNVVSQLEADGFTGLVPLLGAIELASAVLLLIPATRALGLGLTSAYLGGAIATHIQHAQLPTSPAVLQALLWTGVWLRHRAVQGIGFRMPDAQPAVRAVEPRTLWRFAPWISRLVLGVVTLIFLMIGLRFLHDPVAAAGALGVTISRGLATTTLRVGLGAFPLAFAIIVASCLRSQRSLPRGLAIVTVMIGTALVVRAYGIVADDTGIASRHVLTAEAIVFGLATFAMAAEAARRRALASFDLDAEAARRA